MPRAQAILSSMAIDHRELLDFALELASTAAHVILPHYLSCDVDYKKDGSEVTAADREAERAMRRLIEQRYPDHSILGEEYGEQPSPGSRYHWMLDPIDGTASFTLGVPLFSTLVALLDGERPVVGVVNFPAVRETVYAAVGLGCWFRSAASDPVQVHVAADVPLDHAVASATAAHSSDIQTSAGEIPYRVTRLVNSVRKFRFVPDAYQHALVCRGRLHIAVDTVMNPWDIAALVPCIQEAGGLAANLQGQQERPVHGGSLISTCSQRLLDDAVVVLAP